MENKKNNDTLKTVAWVVIITCVILLSALLASGVLKYNLQPINNNEPNKKDTIDNNSDIIQTKLVENIDCNSSETTFNGVTVKLEQEKTNGVCAIRNITINDKDIKNDVSMWVDSYEIYDNNVIISSGNTSGRLFTIYSLSTNSTVMKLQPENLNGYWVTSYTTNNNTITINGKECGEQCGSKSTGYPSATFEIEYSNNTFSDPKLINRTTS